MAREACQEVKEVVAKVVDVLASQIVKK